MNPKCGCFVCAVIWLALLLCLAVTQAAQLQVGPTRPYRSLSALPPLNPGDAVEVDAGTYHEVKRWTRAGTAELPIVIRGVGVTRPIFDATGLNVDGALPNPRAVFQIEGHHIIIENFELRNSRNGDNGAGVRITSANNVTIRNCLIMQCDMGIMSDNNSNLLVEASEIASNGTSLFDGYSHNFYLGGNSATVRFCYIHDSLYGQNFKARTHYVELFYNYIAESQDGELGLVDASETGAVNSHAVLIGNIVVSKPRLTGYNSVRFIQFGQDGGGQHNGTLFAFNNTFVAADGRVQFLSANAAGASIIAENNVFFGSDKIIGTLGGGISGTNNWLQKSATVPSSFFGSVKGTLPGFADLIGRDFRLTASSACRDQGIASLVFFDGQGQRHSGVPRLEYGHPFQNRMRPADERLDLGAYEYRLPKVTELKAFGRDWLISFTAEPGAIYELQRSDTVPGSWHSAQTNIAGVEGNIQLVDTNSVGLARSFYRVKVLN